MDMRQVVAVVVLEKDGHQDAVEHADCWHCFVPWLRSLYHHATARRGLWPRVEAIYCVHVVGTRNLLEALTECGKTPRAVLLASSANVYGNALVELIDESVPPVPENDYAVSKLAMEHIARFTAVRLSCDLSCVTR